MTIRSTISKAWTGALALFLMASGANAAIIYSTNGANTGFSGGGPLTLNQTSGQAASLTFTPNVNISTGVPSNINLGDFTLACATCSTETIGTGATFGAFTFDILITDQTDVATGKFVGTSTGGTVYSDASAILINWSPAQFGPGTFNAVSGNFGSTVFTKVSLISAIVAPNSGTPPGQTTIQAHVDSAVPEPATLGLIGAALAGLVVVRRKKLVA
ncbi:MAG: PEP-CTERM sorting domain-containing protein [Bryobacteraceae bacterium]|nr:PEP-CTERM sorting domain-containing protein [Bryobacteraceae bacterium]